jgi:hypothetical protein
MIAAAVSAAAIFSAQWKRGWGLSPRQHKKFETLDEAIGITPMALPRAQIIGRRAVRT